MKSVLFALVVIPFIHVAAENRLCGNSSLVKTRSCSSQILGTDEFDYDTCKVEVFKANSQECKEMTFRPVMPNKHIGGVSLKPYILPYRRVTDDFIYSANYTVLNITFSNIKWKTMKFRFQRYSHSEVKNHCRNVVISNDVSLNDQSVFYYDCYWSETDGNYNGHNYILDFEASDDVVVNRGQFYFNIPTRKMLSESVSISEWKPFTYIEIQSDSLKLHILPPPKHIKVDAYRIEVMKACDKRTLCEEIVENNTVAVHNREEEVTFEYGVLGIHGSYYFVVTPYHEFCLNVKENRLSVKSPTVFIDNQMQTTYICIASFASLIVAALFAYYIVLRLVRRYWCKDYSLALGSDIPSSPKILVIYSSANKLHAECVTSFVNYLRSEYGLDVMFDGDISATAHGDPYIWNQEAFKVATHVMYVVGPANDVNHFNIYDKPIISIHRNIDTMQLNSLKTYRFKKNVVNVMFEHSSAPIPVETCHDKVFYLLKDWQKLIMYLSKNLLPKQQMLRTEKGRCFLEDLKRAKKLLSTKSNDVVIKLDKCKMNSVEKKVLL